MGISSTALHLLAKIYQKKDRINLDSVCELGAQELNFNDIYLNSYIKFPNNSENTNNIINNSKKKKNKGFKG